MPHFVQFSSVNQPLSAEVKANLALTENSMYIV